MTRGVVLFSIIIALIVFTGYIAHQITQSTAITVKEYENLSEGEQDEDLEIVGKITEISSDYFTIVDAEFPENSVTYYFIPEETNLSDFAVGDVTLAKSTYETDNYKRYLKEMEKLDPEFLNRYNMQKKPFLQITVLEHPEALKNNCTEITYVLNLKNIGDVPISYSDLYDELYGYSIIYKINNKNYLYHVIEEFDTINPGENKRVNFFSPEGTNAQMVKDVNTVQFAWGQKSLYEEEFVPLSVSDIVNINVENKNCE